MPQKVSEWHHTTRELREGYWEVKIVYPDRSKHLAGGFDSREEAEAWVVMWKARKSSWAPNGKVAL